MARVKLIGDDGEVIQDSGAASDIEPIKQYSEVAETLDRMNPKSENLKASPFDPMAIMNPVQLGLINAFDSLCWLDFLSNKNKALSEITKRNSPSLQGTARKQAVEIHGRRQDIEERRGLAGFGHKLFGIR